MERLPYIDTLSAEVDASSEATWAALVGFWAATARSPFAHYARLVGCDPAQASRKWCEAGGSALRPGATVPGFTVVVARAPDLLRLTGRHRFARYELTFALSPEGSGTRLSAETRAAFPGLAGAVYRALVISSGGHELAVRRLLGQVGRRASRTKPVAAAGARTSHGVASYRAM
jgi:hypothetical protein